MSKIGKRPLKIPDGVSVTQTDGALHISGPKGTLAVKVLEGVHVDISSDTITLTAPVKNKQFLMNWGTLRALIGNALTGVVQGFSKTLEIEGVGYKASVEESDLVLKIGFSHVVRFPIPESVSIVVDKNIITVSGIDLCVVGQTAARIRKFKKPEPYLGKGIRYSGEVIRRKAGKKAITGTA